VNHFFKVSVARSVHISIFSLVSSQKYKRTIKDFKLIFGLQPDLAKSSLYKIVHVVGSLFLTGKILSKAKEVFKFSKNEVIY
jgi:hypothetical protein